jgi:hypothetical protein
MVRRTIPTMRELLEDNTFNEYMSAEPVAMRNGRPHRWLVAPGNWQVWVRMVDGKWKTAIHDSFTSAGDLMDRCLDKEDTVADVAVTSKRVFFRPPTRLEAYKVRVKPKDPDVKPYIETRHREVITFTWDPTLEWCARCRRPSQFNYLASDHHALRRANALTTEDAARCVFCGIRRIAMPIDPYSLED